MNDLTDFLQTDDVSDAAIEWVARAVDDRDNAETNRKFARGSSSFAQAMILAARLIQAHRPELIVDPVDAIVRDEMVRRAYIPDGHFFDCAKHLYMMGLEAGKASK